MNETENKIIEGAAASGLKRIVMLCPEFKEQLELQEHWAELEGVDVDEVKKHAKNLVDYIVGLEQARWQFRIDRIIREQHDIEVDASGEDSGDPLDFTASEISQAIYCAERKVRSVNDPGYFNRS